MEMRSTERHAVSYASRAYSPTVTSVPPALGRHGEGWVVLQSVVIVAGAICAIVGPRWPRADEPWLRIAGGVLELAAIVIFVVSRAALGKSFTPLPTPRD